MSLPMLFRPRLAPSSATLIRPFPFPLPPRQPRFPIPGHVLTAYELSRYGPFYHLSGQALPGRYDTCPLFLNPPGSQGQWFIDYDRFNYKPGDVWSGGQGKSREIGEYRSLFVEGVAGRGVESAGLVLNDQGRREESDNAFERIPRTSYGDFFCLDFLNPPYDPLHHHSVNHCNDASIPFRQYGPPGHTLGPVSRIFELNPTNYSYGPSAFGYPFGVGPLEPDGSFHGYQYGPPFSNGMPFTGQFGASKGGDSYDRSQLNGQFHQNGQFHRNGHLHQNVHQGSHHSNGHFHQHESQPNRRLQSNDSRNHPLIEPHIFRSKSAEGLLQSPPEKPDRFFPTLVDLAFHEMHFLPRTYTQETTRVVLAARPAEWVEEVIAQSEDVIEVANQSEESIANHSEDSSPGHVALASMFERLLEESDNEIQDVVDSKVGEENSPESSELTAESDIVLKRFEPSEW